MLASILFVGLHGALMIRARNNDDNVRGENAV
jgi:hypothetical protein